MKMIKKRRLRNLSFISEMTLDELLKDIEQKKGPYSRDRLEHAGNVIEHASDCAKEIRKRLLTGETLKEA